MTRLLTILIAGLTSLAIFAQTPRVPDFSMPKNVSGDATARLDKALNTDNDIQAIRAVADIYLAKKAIDPDLVPEALGLMDSVRGCLKPAPAAILALLEANIYNRIYNERKWIYDSRTAPLIPLPADCREWDSRQFKARITTLADSAIMPAYALKAVPLRNYADIIEQTAVTREYYPNLYTFALQQWALLTSHLPAADTGLPLPLQITYGIAGCVNDSDARQFDSLRALYEKYTDASRRPVTEYAGDILAEMRWAESPDDKKWLYEAISKFIATCPGYWRRGCLENALQQMREREVFVSMPLITGPGRANNLSVEMINVTKARLKVYDVSGLSKVSDQYFILPRGGSLPVPVATLEVTADEEIPFTASRTVEYSFPRVGTYIIIPEFDGAQLRPRQSYGKIYVTGVSLSTSTFGRTCINTVNPEDGSPLDGVQISISQGSQEKRRIGTTDSEGGLTLPDNTNGVLTATLGSDRYAHPLYVYTHCRSASGKWIPAMQGYSSLPLYHPADTAEWSVVLYEFRGTDYRLRTGRTVTAILKDPAWADIDTLILTSDSLGRVCGRFPLPAETLQGHYSIYIDGEGQAVSFTVSDYRLPTFAIKSAEAEQGVPDKGGVTLRGRVMTYSGFPLGNCSIRLELAANRRAAWWRYSHPEKFYFADTVTCADGTFAIPLSAEVLAGAPFKASDFIATITATDMAGESQTTEIRFATSARYYARGAHPQACDITDGRLLVSARTVDWQDSTVNIPVNFRILSPDSTLLLATTVSGGSKEIDVRGIPSGQCIFAYSLPDSVAGDGETANTVLYRTTDKDTPVPGTLLWSPVREIKYGRNNTAEWLYATDCPTHLYVTVTSESDIISRRVIKTAAGMGRIEVSLPAALGKATMHVSATGLYRSEELQVSLSRPDLMKGIRITAETMRRRSVPGTEEVWQLRVTDLDGRGREAGVIAGMYDTALDALARQIWTFNASSESGLYWNSNSTPFGNMVRTSSISGERKMKDCPSVPDPQFMSYGLGWGASSGLRIRGTRQFKSLSLAKGDTDDLVAEVEEEVAMTTADEAAAPMMAAGVSAAKSAMVYADNGSMEESAADEDGVDMSANIGAEASSQTPFSYRESTTPLAFFRPELVTDTDGSLMLRFTLPDANTTWGMQAVAWTDSLLTATYSVNITASRPLMVKPNLPRFIRTTDRVTVPALIMNDTDSVLEAEAVVELFDPADGTVTRTERRNVTMQPGATDTVNTLLTAPLSGTLTGYRVKVSAAGWSDGEQVIVPVLPATTPVIESIPFYISPDSASCSLPLPQIRTGARRELQLCDNPVWYVVAALPGLLDDKASTAPEAARSLFSAAVAEGLLRSNPAIADAISEWKRSDREAETLVSMLERNEDLKTVLLAATPWMTDARGDTERMSRLAMLLEPATVNAAKSAAISTLTKLWNGDGWCWAQQYPRTSEWATGRVLQMCGRLVQLGYLPDNSRLRNMLKDALAADTRRTLKEYARWPKGDYTGYVLLHDLYAPMHTGTPDTRIVSSTLNLITGSWKKASLADKARYTLIAKAHGYNRTAQSILASIGQFSVSDPAKGTWYPSAGSDALTVSTLIMQAYMAADPQSPVIDGIRQWITVQKSMQDWGESAGTTDIIATFLTASSRWIVPAEGATVTLDGESLPLPRATRFTGEVSVPLPASASVLTVTRRGDTPTSGAVYSIYTAPLPDVKPASVPGLEIEKTLTLQRPDGTAETVTDNTPLTPGDKVTVTLTIRAGETMDYVVVTDSRPACLEPDEQLPTPVWSEGLCFYRENRDTETRLFIDRLPKGIYLLSYTLHVNSAGSFASGIATVQSQYAPKMTARSGAMQLTVD